MPDRTTIVLPPRLKQQATALARKQKISFAEFVRQAVKQAITDPPKRSHRRDPFWTDVAVYDGPVPADFSINHDKYLYGEIEQE